MQKTILGGALAAMLAAAPAHATMFSISIAAAEPYVHVGYDADGRLGVYGQGKFDLVTINPGDSLEVAVAFAQPLVLRNSGTFGLALMASRSPDGGVADSGQAALFHQIYNEGQDRLVGLNAVLPAGFVDVVNFSFAYVGPAFPNSEIVLGGYQLAEYTAPEPSTWAMGLIGFAAVAFLSLSKDQLRRRKKTSVA